MTGAFEQMFNPAQAAARRELQRQRDLGARLPAATDPPGDAEEPGENRVAAPGRRGTPFSGIVVLRRPARPESGEPAEPFEPFEESEPPAEALD